MITEELRIFIQSQLDKKIHPNAIRAILLSHGWLDDDIAVVFLELGHSTKVPSNAVVTHTSRHASSFIRYVATIIISVGFSLFLSGVYLGSQASHSPKQVVSPLAMAVVSPTAIPSPTPTPSMAPQPTITKFKGISVANRKQISLAIIGDSMVDTMGEHLEYLQSILANPRPTYTFTFYNYGIGAQNIQQGLARFNSSFDYKTRHYPALSQLHPDIIIVASFSYNPFSPPDPAKHKTLLSQLVVDAKQTGAKVYLLAEIAPLEYDFAKGPNGIADWTDEYRAQHAQEIIDQLNNVSQVAKEQAVPLIDAFDKSKSHGDFGSYVYTGTGDGIHPSAQGHILMANLITSALGL